MEYKILLGLSAKTLSKFKCVCKAWSSLISSPLFQQHHFSHHYRKDPLLLTTIFTDDNDTINLNFSTYSNYNNLQTPVVNFSTPWSRKQDRYYNDNGSVVDDNGSESDDDDDIIVEVLSCEGLLCITLGRSYTPLLCNPSTEEVLALPPVFKNNLLYTGFGYTASTKEFKVVRFYTNFERQTNYCKVLTVGENIGHCWRDAKPLPFEYSNGIDNRGDVPFSHGALHYLIPGQDDSTYYIAVFDLESESYRDHIQFPEDTLATHWRENHSVWGFNELAGSLCIGAQDTIRNQQMELWILKDYHNNVWEKWYTIDYSSLDTDCIGALPLAHMSDGVIIFDVLHADEKTDLLCYNPDDEVVTQKIQVSRCIPAVYMETFFHLGTNCEQRKVIWWNFLLWFCSTVFALWVRFSSAVNRFLN